MKKKLITFELTAFRWSVCDSGYRVEEAEGMTVRLFPDGSEKHLVPCSSLQHESLPLENNLTLYRRFAGLRPTERAILDFARMYGLLHAPPQPLSKGDDATGERTVRGETLAFWNTATQQMRLAVEVWDVICTPKVAELHHLANLLEMNREASPSGSTLLDVVADSSFTEHPYFTDSLTASDLSAFAEKVYTYLVADLINTNLEPLAPQVRPNHYGGNTPIHVAPTTLLSAMWLQLAVDVAETGVGDYKRCERCGKWMSAKINRSDKRTCSKACKIAMQRKHKRESEG